MKPLGKAVAALRLPQNWGLGGFLLLNLLAYPLHAASENYHLSPADESGHRSIYVNDGNDNRDYGEVVGKTKFLRIWRKHSAAEIIIYSHEKKLYTLTEARAYLDGAVYLPGAEGTWDTFFLSPDRQYLLIDRFLAEEMNAHFLYHNVGHGRMEQVHLHGHRFDEAALADYAARRHYTADDFEGATHVGRFIRWDLKKHRLIFSLLTASYWVNGDHPTQDDASAYWIGAFDLRSRRFYVIRDERGFHDGLYFGVGAEPMRRRKSPRL